ncbi:hypothetical protein OEZ86_011173 [Tetradesmus obliquus]|nr:hypothetical protein OEZ86_011173 [Tetradesmus obliquus]
MAEERLARLKQEQAAKEQRRAAGKEEEGAANAARADKHQRSELLRAAHIRRIRAKAGDEARKVEEVSFINTLNNEGKKADLQQRLEEGEARRAEALAAILAKQAGAAASIKEAAERRRAAEAERLAQLADKQRRKQEAQAKLEQERLAAAAAREAAKAAARAGAQQREAARQQQAAWLSSRVNARLKEAAQRRVRHLELIRERAALGKDFERRDSFTAASPGTRSGLQGLLHLLCKEVLSAAGGSLQTEGDAEARMLALLGRLLELPLNLDCLLTSGPLLPSFAKATLHALDHCNSLEADEPSMTIGGEASSRLSMLLQVLVAVLEHTPDSIDLVKMQEELVGYMIAAGTLGRLASVFSLFDQPMKDAARPVPPHVLQCLRLLRGLTAVRCPSNELLVGKRWPTVNPNAAAIIMDLQATAMAGVLSLLTAVLLNAAPGVTPAEASCRALPPNFVEAANLVMAVLNNVCCLDLLAAQHMLSSTHNRLEFFHLIR